MLKKILSAIFVAFGFIHFVPALFKGYDSIGAFLLSIASNLIVFIIIISLVYLMNIIDKLKNKIDVLDDQLTHYIERNSSSTGQSNEVDLL